MGGLGISLFIQGSEACSSFTSMTLQKMNILNIFAERPIKIQRAHTSFSVFS